MAGQVWAPEHVRGRGDAEVARLAGHQHGVVSRAQLLAAGLTGRAIAHRVAVGRLYVMHKGVYLVGRPSPELWSAGAAAILFFGGHAVLSHRYAAALWGIIEAPPQEVSVTLVGRDRRARPGLEIHRTAAMAAVDLRLRSGLPVTAPARTLLDLAAVLAPDALELAVAQARVRRLVRSGQLEATVRRSGRRKGVGRLRALLQSEAGPSFTRRAAERRMLSLVRSAGLPAPHCNAPLLGFEVDFIWAHERVVVEIDGHQFHGHRRAFESDRRRDQILVAAGYRVMRITWRQLQDEPLAVIARLAMALGAQAA